MTMKADAPLAPTITGKLWILYDGRAVHGNTDSASVYCTARSFKEAKRDRREMFPDAIIFSYDTTDTNMLINEQQETW